MLSIPATGVPGARYPLPPLERPTVSGAMSAAFSGAPTSPTHLPTNTRTAPHPMPPLERSAATALAAFDGAPTAHLATEAERA